jgi:glycerol-1-phosphate dehydrogenase [NAD(P)+]
MKLQDIIAKYDFDLKNIDISVDATKNIIKYLSRFDKKIIVCDENCQDIADKLLVDATRYIFEANCKASIENIQKLRYAIKDFNVVVAVGSGSISDLCKYSSYLEGKDCVIYATAPSMNGYASKNSSIINKDGLKESLAAKLPNAIFMDLEVLSSAPLRLIKSGIADSLCYASCARDWQMDYLFFGGNYNIEAMNILSIYEQEIIQKLDDILSGDCLSMAKLAEALIIAGIMMTICGGSYPCSQSEHMIAHSYHYLDDDAKNNNFHGEEIAVTTYFMLRLQEFICEYNWQDIVLYDDQYYAEISKNKNKKIIYLKKNLHYIKKTWQHSKHNIVLSTLQSENFKKICSNSGLPLYCYDLRWDKKKYLKAIKAAPLTRDRFTFLDLASCLGLIDIFCSSQKL